MSRKVIYIDNRKVTDFRVERRTPTRGWVTLYVDNNTSAHNVPLRWANGDTNACFTGGRWYSHQPIANPVKHPSF